MVQNICSDTMSFAYTKIKTTISILKTRIKMLIMIMNPKCLCLFKDIKKK